LSFRFTERREFDPEEIEIARALESQAALAIQVTRLAKAARQAAILKERARLAGEIHDGLAQSFTAICMQLGVAEQELSSKEGEHELLRIAQEVVHNAVRHANPTVIRVTLQWDAPNLVLQVRDNGSGIAAARLEASEGLGLGNMRERASEIGGRFEIQTAAGRGTNIIVTLPILVI
jgi:signal transduction histidine kinase